MLHVAMREPDILGWQWHIQCCQCHHPSENVVMKIFSLLRSIFPDLWNEVLVEGEKLKVERALRQLPKDGL
jgi:hypothetical protein